MLAVFGNDSISRILLHVRRRGCVPSVELWRGLRLTSIPAQFVQRNPTLQDVRTVKIKPYLLFLTVRLTTLIAYAFNLTPITCGGWSLVTK